MISCDTLVLRPPAAASHATEMRDCLQALGEALAARGLGGDELVALTFFVHAGDAYLAHKQNALALVRTLFGRAPPPTTVVAQDPAGPCHVALEATVLADADAVIERRRSGATPYSLIRRGETRQVHCGGIGCDPRLDDTEAQATEAFGAMQSILAQENLSFGQVVRQWGYIEGLLDVRPDGPVGHQRYQAFNDVRGMFYASADFPAGYPAATGIGQSAGGVALEFIALDAPPEVRVAPVSNPRQTDAHCYSGGSLVGDALPRLGDKSTPKFERAKRVVGGDGETIFVSGTASIVGERSVGIGDVAAQTRTTIDNISALVGDRGLSRLRAYVRRPRDFAVVRAICEEAFGDIPALYLQADVCRDDLLVELEGALQVGARLPAARAGRA